MVLSPSSFSVTVSTAGSKVQGLEGRVFEEKERFPGVKIPSLIRARSPEELPLSSEIKQGENVSLGYAHIGVLMREVTKLGCVDVRKYRRRGMKTWGESG